jgi:deoxyribonuclease-4
MIFGAHCSTSGGFYTALERAKSIGAESCQIFVKNNMQWFGKPPLPDAVARFEQGIQPSGVSAIFGHTGYLINLGAAPSPNRDNSLRSLIQEIEFAETLGLPFLVMHPGAHLGAGEAAALEQIIAGLDEVFSATKRARVRIALENTAGQGSCLGHKIEHLAAIFEGVKRTSRLGVCLDTAHFYAAGYDIRTRTGWDAAIEGVASLIGLSQVLAFHLNDSKTALNSRVDRHAHIGQGHIGKEGFRHIVRDERFLKTPACLETPKGEDLKEDVRNLKVLRRLACSSREKERQTQSTRQKD